MAFWCADRLGNLFLNDPKRRFSHVRLQLAPRVGYQLARQFVAQGVVRHLAVIPVLEELQIPHFLKCCEAVEIETPSTCATSQTHNSSVLRRAYRIFSRARSANAPNRVSASSNTLSCGIWRRSLRTKPSLKHGIRQVSSRRIALTFANGSRVAVCGKPEGVSYTVGEWTLNASLTTSSSYRRYSMRRALDRSAQATSRLQIEGTTRRMRIARGFGSGSIMASAAELSLRYSA